MEFLCADSNILKICTFFGLMALCTFSEDNRMLEWSDYVILSKRLLQESLFHFKNSELPQVVLYSWNMLYNVLNVQMAYWICLTYKSQNEYGASKFEKEYDHVNWYFS